ncbi:MAG: ABC transporter ATP-binding protein [Solobacterium sp.]|nr:ABC transporter ATP-binding protein [Solobacterium sp.]
MLKIEHLEKSFGSHPVLKDLNLELQKGSVFGLVGVNGAGKSTLLRLIAGVYQPDGGSIQFEGKDTFRDADIRASISFVSDEPYYEPGTTMESMKLLYESVYPFDPALFKNYCEEFELDPSKPIAGFSKGMKRRMSIIFGLCTHPKLLLLDEAYDGLEPLARLKFKRILAERIEEENLSVIIASHSLRELEDICDSFGILENGQISEYGDLIETKGKVNKYQAAFSEEVTKDQFSGLDILSFQSEGRVVQMVVRGEEETVRAELAKHDPVLVDVLPVTFEELFIYELESRG